MEKAAVTGGIKKLREENERLKAENQRMKDDLVSLGVIGKKIGGLFEGENTKEKGLPMAKILSFVPSILSIFKSDNAKAILKRIQHDYKEEIEQKINVEKQSKAFKFLKGR